ncbi:MAG: hypothetical protein ABIE70_00660 [bacterium]
MKIGKLNFKPHAAKKPVMMSLAGKFMTAKDVFETVTLGSVLALGEEQKKKLVLERYRLEPDFKIGTIGHGLLTKKDVMGHIQADSELGREFMMIELGYCNELMSSLKSKTLPAWPKIPTKVIPKVPYWKPIKKCIHLRLRTRALFCENTTDSVTGPFAAYRKKHVHPVFQKRGFFVDVLDGTDDVRSKFAPKARQSLTVYISGIGHGNYSVYTGHHGNHILEVCKYDPAEVKGKSIHFLSCQTAGKLGPDTIKKGANSYAGYSENFHLIWDVPGTPGVNEFELFAKSDSTYDIAMALGATAQQAYNLTVAAFNAAIAQVPGTQAASLLTWDRDHLKRLGSATAIIRPYRWVKICFPITKWLKEEALAEAGDVTD